MNTCIGTELYHKMAWDRMDLKDHLVPNAPAVGGDPTC